jgi:uncharacterized protein (TIGR02271 family)
MGAMSGGHERAEMPGVQVKPDEPEEGFAETTVIPVAHEVPVVSKRTVQTGRVRIEKTVSEREVVIDEPLLHHEVQIERTPIGRDVSAAKELQSVRYEGETMIVPVLEEVPVLVKRIILTEEIRITRVKREVRDPQTVKLRVEKVSVEHLDEESGTTPTNE